MALTLASSTSYLKLNQSPISFSTQTTPQSKTLLCFKSKLPISKHSFSKSFTSKAKTPTCTYKDQLVTNDDETKIERTKSLVNPVSDTESNSHKIWWSEVEVKNPKKVFVGRKWNRVDIEIFSVWVVMHGLALFAPFTFNWGAFGVAVVLYVVTGMLGICLSYHRHLSHKSFKLPKWLEYTFAYCGVLAYQRDPIFWVSTHRHHHQFIDTEQDLHSPIGGFWFSHISWMFDSAAINEKCHYNYASDLVKQPFYRFISRTYGLHPILLGVLLYALGGFPYLVWGVGVRTIMGYHMVGFINSACHLWGKQAWNTGDLSKNNWMVAMVAFGEGWHNNHHAFGYSARHGLEWWQIDMTWYTIKFLEFLGLATDVKLPTEDHKQRLSFENE